MVTYDKGLLSLPEDIIHEIIRLLDAGALRSCSLTGKRLSYSAKPLLHRTVHLTPPSGGPDFAWDAHVRWSELEGLPVLGKRGLLQHTRHVSIALHHDTPFSFFAYGFKLDPHIQHLRTLTNLRSLKVRQLDTTSFIPKMGEYFGTFLGTLESLELESPRGDPKEILYFVCHFTKLRDLKVEGISGHIKSTSTDDLRFDIRTSPPLNGTLDLPSNMNMKIEGDSIRTQLFLRDLATLPSGLKFQTLKFSGCTPSKLQPLVDACAPTLEHMKITCGWAGASCLHTPNSLIHNVWLSEALLCPRLSFERHPAFQKLEIKLGRCRNTESAAGWLSETLSTITSKVFIELTVSMTLISFTSHTENEGLVRGWGSIDNVLDQFNLCEDASLVAGSLFWLDDGFRDLVERHFPLMWKRGRVVLEVPPLNAEDDLLLDMMFPPYYRLFGM